MLPNDYQKFYVYSHKDPRTEEIVYIGRGSKDRAWHYRVSMSRRKNHTKYLLELENLGYLPSDWVYILVRNLSLEEAEEYEKSLIKKYTPRFNMTHTGKHKRINKEKIKEAKELLEKGIVGREASKKLEISVMSTWRYQYEY